MHHIIMAMKVVVRIMILVIKIMMIIITIMMTQLIIITIGVYFNVILCIMVLEKTQYFYKWLNKHPLTIIVNSNLPHINVK